MSDGVLPLRGYFDETGHSADPEGHVCGVGGAISTSEKWTECEPVWKAILDRFGVTHLHMVDFAHSRGEFTSWRDDNERREAFLKELMDLIHRYVDICVGAWVSLEEFKKLTTEQQKAIRNPYFACFQECWRVAAVQAVNLPADEKIDIVVAHQPEHSGEATPLAEALRVELPGTLNEMFALGRRLGTYSTGDPKNVVGLQVADLVVYEISLYVQRQCTPDYKPRWPMRRLLEMKHPPNFLKVDFTRLLPAGC